jgi:hypothetical protein
VTSAARTVHLCDNRYMLLDRFDFSCMVALRDGTLAEVEQTSRHLDKRHGMTFFMTVRPHGHAREERPPFAGALHLSGSSLSALSACPGNTRAELSTAVTDALRAWVREHGLSPDFVLDVGVGDGHGRRYGVAISPR